MGYTVHFTCRCCGRGPDDLPQPTYNLTAIFDFALTGEALPNPEVSEVAVVLLNKTTDRPRGLRIIDGLTGEQSLEKLRHALASMAEPTHAKAYQDLEPRNQWGSLAGAWSVLDALLKAAEEWPGNVWGIR